MLVWNIGPVKNEREIQKEMVEYLHMSGIIKKFKNLN